MIKKLFTLLKLGRKLAKSDILNIVSKFKKPPLAIKIYFKYFLFPILKDLIQMIQKEKDFPNHYNLWELLSLNWDSFWLLDPI